MVHFLSALRTMGPSTQRGSDARIDVRPINWQKIGGLDHVKMKIKQVNSIRYDAVMYIHIHMKKDRRIFDSGQCILAYPAEISNTVHSSSCRVTWVRF